MRSRICLLVAFVWFWNASCLVLVADDAPSNMPLAKQSPESTSMPTGSLDAIDDIVAYGLANQRMPGAVVMVGHRGAIVFHKAYGLRSSLPEPLPMLEDTVFDLASLTKPIATASCIMRLVQTGELALDDKVADHLAEFGAQGKHLVTIKQLLLHTGGLIPDNAMADYQDGADVAREKLLGLSLKYKPGTRFRYSDVGFQVLGELIEEKTEMSLAEFSAKEIFRPLGMNETGYLPERKLRARAAATEQREGRWMVGEVHDPRAYAVGGVAGHAGLFSTANDLAIYSQMLIEGGTLGNAKIFTREIVDQMTKGYEAPSGVPRRPWERALGWDKRTGYSSNRGESMTQSAFGHGGFTGTSLWIDPELELFVIFLSNRVHPDGSGSVNALAGEIGKVAADAARAARVAD